VAGSYFILDGEILVSKGIGDRLNRFQITMFLPFSQVRINEYMEVGYQMV